MPRPDPGELWRWCETLVPVPRGLIGPNAVHYLEALDAVLPLEMTRIPSGTRVNDWIVPDEWHLREARLSDPTGRVVADAAVQPLSVVGHSEAFRGVVSRADLETRLHSLSDRPDLVPWRTSYYERTWGFCLPDSVRRALPDGDYTVEIDADLRPGHLVYGEHVVAGSSPQEIVVASHTCHPASANDNVSGNVVALAVARALSEARPRYTYRFLFGPGTIGAIAWLAQGIEEIRHRTRGGFVLSGLGDRGAELGYKLSRRGTSPTDRAMRLALRDRSGPHRVDPFEPWGYDERQFNTQGADLGVGLFSRTRHGTYPEYHTSADDLSFLSADSLIDSVDTLLAAIEILEAEECPAATVTVGEPQLGRYDLYDRIGGRGADESRMAILWTLNLADGARSLVEIAEQSGLRHSSIVEAAERLRAAGLLVDSDQASVQSRDQS